MKFQTIFKTRGVIFASLLLAVVLGFLIPVGFLLPVSSHLERVTYIKAVPETVYGLLEDLREFHRWSPWAQTGSETQYTFTGPQRGIGASLSWRGNESSGRQTIIDVSPHNKVRMLLEFEGKKQAIGTFHLDALEGGTHIRWVFEIHHGNNLVSRYRGLMLDRWMGRDYEQGLRNLRKLAESLPVLPAVELLAENIDYEVDGVTYTGYLAYDRNRVPRPGVLIIHDAWGRDDFITKRADALAHQGFTAFAADMYGQSRRAGNPDEMRQLSDLLLNDFQQARQIFDAAFAVLKNHLAADSQQVAAIGYGLGGTLVLNLARVGTDLKGAVSFYGELRVLSEAAEAGRVRSKILVLNGADDARITPEQKQVFYQEMDAAGVDYELIDFPDANRGFTDPAADDHAQIFELPLAYHAQADRVAWQRLRIFFNRIFQ